MNDVSNYESYQGLPVLAGLCSMERATEASWSVEASLVRLKRIHFVLRRVHQILISKITAQPIYELKTAFSYHGYLCAEQVSMIRQRVSEMREPPLGLEAVPHPSLQLAMDEVSAAPDTEHLVAGIYEVVIPLSIQVCEKLRDDAHPLADAPTVRVAKLIAFELEELAEFGRQAVECLIVQQRTSEINDWKAHLQQCFAAAGGIDGCGAESDSIPNARFSSADVRFDNEPKRDERFIDSYNAGVNPEAFLYDDAFSDQDKTLMMYYKRIRELDVPEMMATILVELVDEEPWGFHMEMSRQLWDEARHAMMGEVGFASIGIEWRKIPINFTWSRNLNLQLDPRERHGVLFFIEQNLMPKTGKRFEWETANQSGDPLSALFQDFDWADEVLHAQIGRRWYVPRYESLNEALSYGDKCWSKVLSHWRSYLEQGLTEHRNWWPDLYREACEKWGKTPDARTLAYCETYEDKRADLASLD